MKKTIVFFLLMESITVSAQELWIQPAKFICRRTETVNLRFYAGEAFKGKPWKGNSQDFEFIRLYFENVVDKNLDDNLSNLAGDSIQLALFEEGTVVVTAQTRPFSIPNHKEALNLFIDTADYLLYRDSLKTDSIEYIYSLKNIFQVGVKTDGICKDRKDLPIDIVPKDHPYSFKKDGNFKVKIYLWNEPLKNTKIRVLHKLDSKISEFEYITDDDGEVKFFLSSKGEWMIRCVKIVNLQSNDKAEWKTYAGILTWGYY